MSAWRARHPFPVLLIGGLDCNSLFLDTIFAGTVGTHTLWQHLTLVLLVGMNKQKCKKTFILSYLIMHCICFHHDKPLRIQYNNIETNPSPKRVYCLSCWPAHEKSQVLRKHERP